MEAFFFKYSPEIRRLINTTNVVESIHRQFRKVTKTKSLFPHDDALHKILYFAYKDLRDKLSVFLSERSITMQDGGKRVEDKKEPDS